MSERHSSSQIPRPATPASAGFAERRLQPLSEMIMGFPAYGNAMGKRFTVKSEFKGRNQNTRDIRIEIEEVAPDRPSSFKVLADLTVDADSVCIVSVRNQLPGSKDTFLGLYGPPPASWRGLDFLGVILEEAKRIASERHITIIETIPNDKKLVEYCLRHGFVADPDDMFGRMVYRMDSATA